MEKAASLAVNGAPLENVTPSRTLNVHWLGGLVPFGGEQRLQVAGVGVALDEGFGDVGADDDAGGRQGALAGLEGGRFLGQDDAQGVGVVTAMAGVGDGAAGGGHGDSREGDGQGLLSSRGVWAHGSSGAAGVTSTYVDETCDRRHGKDGVSAASTPPKCRNRSDLGRSYEFWREPKTGTELRF